MEDELEVVWQSTSKENQRIRALLRATRERTGLWDSRTLEDLGLDGSSQVAVLDSYVFSYCDLNTPATTCQSSGAPGLGPLCLKGLP